MSERTCYVCEEPIALGERAVIEYVRADDAVDVDDEVLVESTRHPTCLPELEE